MVKREKQWTTTRNAFSRELQLVNPSGNEWTVGNRDRLVRRIARLLNEDDARKASRKKAKVKK
jgi:hypothetical protein